MEDSTKNKRFIQVIIQKGIISNEDIIQLSHKIFNDRDPIRHIVEINRELQKINMEIRSAKDEQTGETFWAHTSIVKDPKTIPQTEYTQGQLDLLRTIFLKIVDDGYIASIQAIHLSDTIEPRMSHVDAEKTIKSMASTKWLNMKEGLVYMGVRSIIELMPYFRDAYEEHIYICPLCNLSAFHGHKCDNCQVVFHLYCLVNYKNVNGGELNCSQCQNPLTVENLQDIQPETLNTSHGNDEVSPPVNSQRVRRNKRRHL